MYSIIFYYNELVILVINKYYKRNQLTCTEGLYQMSFIQVEIMEARQCQNRKKRGII